jgi:hypothetical protein
MKSLGLFIATAAIAVCGQALAGTPTCARQQPAPAEPRPALGPEFAPPIHPAYPTFCSIPPAPTNIPAADAFKAEVVKTRLAGAVITRDTGPDTWTLAGTDEFLETGRREAEPPPPAGPVGPAETAAFLAEAKAKAEPPPKPRHRR